MTLMQFFIFSLSVYGRVSSDIFPLTQQPILNIERYFFWYVVRLGQLNVILFFLCLLTFRKAQLRCYGFMITPLQLSDLRISRNGGIKFFLSVDMDETTPNCANYFCNSCHKVTVYLVSWPLSEHNMGYSNTIFSFFKLQHMPLESENFLISDAKSKLH